MINKRSVITLPDREPNVVKQGFTSMDLLVVIGILAVFFAIFLPALTHPKASASSVCRNNLRQIGLGFMMYSQDYSDTLVGWGWEFHEPVYAEPVDRRISGGERQADLTTGRLWDYMRKSSRVFRCPSYTVRRPSNSRFWGFNATVPVLPYPLWSYVANVQAAMSCRRASDSTLDIQIAALHTPPATTLLVLEPQNNNGYDNGIVLFSGLMPPESQDHLGTYYHTDVGNLAFMDGHAASMTWKQYTNACSGLENAKQFFGGSYEYVWP